MRYRGTGALLAFILAATVAGRADAQVLRAWVQMVQGGAEARAAVAGPACPTLEIDGRPTAMTERAGPDQAFPNRMCEARIVPGARSVSIGGAALPTPKPRPRRIVVIGDTGCRLKGMIAQHCNNPSGWPFARVAALAAASKPDLVVHVGDYYYRETPCPSGDAACAGSPYGDRWATWKAELFDPAAPLLAAAPWVFARGNHEDCKRGGMGWFRLLDAAPSPKTCPAASDTFWVDTGGPRLFVVDSADTDDRDAPDALVSAFEREIAPAAATGVKSAWIITHRPFWAVDRLGGFLIDGRVNATERAAAKHANLASVDLILAGHVHDFESMDFGRARPAQLIVGTSGDLLQPYPSGPLAGGRPQVDGLPSRAFSMGRFGYFVLDREGEGWRGVFRDLDDKVRATCTIRRRSLACKAV